ncbi:chorismate-binding protein [Thermaurantiacus sp.]
MRVPLAPFVWVASGGGRLFADPARVIVAQTVADVRPALREARALAARGFHLAGGLAFEAGAAFEPRVERATAATMPPLLWLGAFGAPQPAPSPPDPERATWVGPPRPRLSLAAYRARVDRLGELIAAGDLYQANLSFRADVPVRGHPVALFARLWAETRPAHAALVATGEAWWLSLSPERFFALEAGRLVAQPMKGTAPRGGSEAEDEANAQALAADPKNRAENLMITDLLRNDLARVAVPGSVRVPALFAVGREPYVLQMTSTVEARLGAGLDAFDVLEALFPCGSVTGAPKIRSQQAIAALEPEPRGAYCGAIGTIGPGGQSADFNVAIRTLVLDPARPSVATLGLGSGVVADSRAEAEWTECLAKARFLSPQRPLSLIETMRREPDGTIPRLLLHLDRLGRSARRFGFPFDRKGTEALLASGRVPEPQRLRLLLARSGALALQVAPAPPSPPAPLRVAIVPLPVPADDWRLCHKTSARAFYDDARRRAGTDEVVFMRPDGLLTEGSFTNLFVARGGRLLTPPAALGLLPGVLRAELLETGEASEAPLRADDLASGFLLGNSLRGLLPARLVASAPEA